MGDVGRCAGACRSGVARLAVVALLASTLAVVAGTGSAGADESPPSFIAQFGSSGSGDGQLSDPRGVAVDGGGNVYVADEQNDRVQKFGGGGGAPPPVNYVALGDSSAAGFGVAPFFDTGADGCERSTRAYAALLRLPGHTQSIQSEAAAGGPGAPGWGFFACSGAVTGDLDGTPPHAINEFAEVDQWSSVNARQPTLATLQIGGNDIGFAHHLDRCHALPDCRTNVQNYYNRKIGAYRVHLARVLADLRSRTSSAWIISYAQLFPRTTAEQNCSAIRSLGFSNAEQNFFRTLQVHFLQEIKTITRAAGVHFVNATSRFAGHEICGHSGEWVSGETVHPNAAGQRQFARLLESRMQAEVDASCPLDATGLPANPTPGVATAGCG